MSDCNKKSNRNKIGNTHKASLVDFYSHPIPHRAQYLIIIYCTLSYLKLKTCRVLVTSQFHCDAYNFYISLTKWQ